MCFEQENAAQDGSAVHFALWLGVDQKNRGVWCKQVQGEHREGEGWSKTFDEWSLTFVSVPSRVRGSHSLFVCFVKQSVNHSALLPGSCFLMPGITPSRLKAAIIPLRAYHPLKRSLIWLVPMMETGICQSHRTQPRPRPRMNPRGRRKPLPRPHRPRKRAHVFLGYAPGYGLRVHELSTQFCWSRSTPLTLYSLIAYLNYLGLTVYY